MSSRIKNLSTISSSTCHLYNVLPIPTYYTPSKSIKNFIQEIEFPWFSSLIHVIITQGEKLLNIPLTRTCQATAMAWHPTKKILAVGWDNGELLVWNEHDHELHESLPLHKTSITVLGWSSAGTRLSSGDKVKIWNIWDPYHEIHSNILKSYT